MIDDVKGTRKLIGAAIGVMISLYPLELYLGSWSWMNWISRLFPIYISLGAYHRMKDFENGKESDPMELFFWIHRYFPKRRGTK